GCVVAVGAHCRRSRHLLALRRLRAATERPRDRHPRTAPTHHVARAAHRVPHRNQPPRRAGAPGHLRRHRPHRNRERGTTRLRARPRLRHHLDTHRRLPHLDDRRGAPLPPRLTVAHATLRAHHRVVPCRHRLPDVHPVPPRD